ncbi:MAG: FixH family protein, partial [Flammeovirgaceae bacterium]
VSVNSYEEDLQYNEKMTQKKNAHELAELPIISVSNERLIISYAKLSSVQKGLIKLTRPSDSHFDQAFDFNKSLASPHSFVISQPQKGLYRLSVQWKMDNKEYFIERNIVL